MAHIQTQSILLESLRTPRNPHTSLSTAKTHLFRSLQVMGSGVRHLPQQQHRSHAGWPGGAGFRVSGLWLFQGLGFGFNLGVRV